LEKFPPVPETTLQNPVPVNAAFAFKVVVLVLHRVESVWSGPAFATVGLGIILTFILSELMQVKLFRTLKMYLPAPALVMPGIVGFFKMDVKPLGPVHE
jgi:hypothetical protein